MFSDYSWSKISVEPPFIYRRPWLGSIGWLTCASARRRRRSRGRATRAGPPPWPGSSRASLSITRWCSSGTAPLGTSWRQGPRCCCRWRRAGEHGRLWGGHAWEAARRMRRGGEFLELRRRWRKGHGGGRVRPYLPRAPSPPVATGVWLSRVFLASSVDYCAEIRAFSALPNGPR